MPTLRNATERDFPAIVELNLAEVQHTSPMSLTRLTELVRMSAYCKVAEVDNVVGGFLLAFREGTEYDSDNYQWFCRELSRFVYVDRIVVGKSLAGQGVGGAFYKDLFGFARDSQVDSVTCEYNITPPNLPSKAFHDKFGFQEMGTQWVANNTKQVSLQMSKVQL
ncbi:MAG: GNAT family N-acetyltransferase [Burkholderiaceae bacterium]